MREHYDFSKMKGRKNLYLKGASKNSDFFVSARSRSAAETTAEGWPEGRGRSPSNHRAENRSVHRVHEESLPRETLWAFEHGADAVIAEKVHF